VEAVLARQPVDPAVDARRHLVALGPAEEIADEETHLFGGHHPGADRSPEVLQREAGELLRPGALGQAASGLRRVEVDVATLLLHYAPQELAQRRMAGHLGQAAIAGLGGPLVDGAPGHVQGDEGAPGEGGRADGAKGGECVASAAALAECGYPGVARLLAVGPEHLADSLAVPHLLEDPAGEERGDHRVAVRRGEEEITQVADGMVLDVVHVAQAAECPGRQGPVLEVVEVDACEVEPARPGFVGLNGGSHGAYYSDHRRRPDEPDGRHPVAGVIPNRTYMHDIGEVSDAQLVTSIARYSEVALAEAYRRHGGAVYGLARRVLNNSSEAEDVTQEVFLRLWNQPDRFDASRGSLRSFLLAQSHGRAVDTVRSHNSRRVREARDARRTATAEYDMQHEVWDMALADQVTRALGTLPDEERRAIEMAYFSGHTYVEVAQLLDQPEGTVKSRIRNGLRRLRTAMTDAGVLGADVR
jgi:RNA polymerase sigma-70 factor, ECF subfamily